MRLKIIVVNALIMAVVGILGFVLCRAAVVDVASNRNALLPEATHDVSGAAARFELDGLEAERWLAAKAEDPGVSDLFDLGSPQARSDAATARADKLLGEMRVQPTFARGVPTLVVVVDIAGRVVGRNASTMQRGEDFAARYPALKASLTSGVAASELWLDKDRFLASFVPIRKAGKVLGLLVAARPLNDELTRVSDAATGRGLGIAVVEGANVNLVAQVNDVGDVLKSATGGDLKALVTSALQSGQPNVAPLANAYVAAAPMRLIGDGRAAIVAVHPLSLISDPSALAWPALAAAGLGLFLVIIAGWLLGGYISTPIAALEEGLLAVLNGQNDLRFEMQHAEVGGLAFRIDQLLNELMGVDEDTTDADGRSSKPPMVANFADAMGVDGGADARRAQTLAALPEAQYLANLYREYIAAKEKAGQPTSHIDQQSFEARIRGMEEQSLAAYGRRVRYAVELRGSEVTLLSVPGG
jgi:hypothetical protein